MQLTGIFRFWKIEKPDRDEEEKAHDFLKECEAVRSVVEDLIRGEKKTPEDESVLKSLKRDCLARIPTCRETVPGRLGNLEIIDTKPVGDCP